MYAAAGGASLASRKARQNKQKKTQQAAEKLAKDKANSDLTTPTRGVQQSRQFHQLPATYLRTPGGPSRKLSVASYAQHSKSLLPIHEGHSHAHHHHSHHHQHAQPGTYQYHLQQQHLQHHHQLQAQQHQQQQQQQQLHKHHDHRPGTPRLVHRHDGDGGVIVHSHLTKSATATLPLVSQMEDGTPPSTPLISINTSGVGVSGSGGGDRLLPPKTGRGSLGSADLSGDKKPFLHTLPIPQDSIIVTPATPMASPGHSPKTDDVIAREDDLDTKSISDIKPQLMKREFFGPGPISLERKCSFNRIRPRSNLGSVQAFDYAEDDCQSYYNPPELTQAQLHHYRDYTDDSRLIPPTSPLANGGGSFGGHKWAQCAYCEEGICICEHIECAQGKAAWLERGRRCSVQDNNQPAVSHKKWVQDTSLGGSSDDEDLLGVLRGPSSFANAFLYVGLGTVAIGLVIAFVGTGEKGFKTVELRLIGPSLIGIGLVCCILRICFCICPSHCISSSRRARKKNSNKVDADHTTSLLRGESKRVSIAKGPQKFQLARKKSNNKMLNEGMEALRQIASTSLFLQNEQKPSTTSNRIVPIIKEPEKPSDSPLEMKKLDTTLNISDITDDEDDDDDSGDGGNNSVAANHETVTIAASTSNSFNNTNLQNNSISSKDKPTDSSLQRTSSKLGRQRIALNQQQQQQSSSLDDSQSIKNSLDVDTLLMETSLMIINPTPPPATASTNAWKLTDIATTTTSSELLDLNKLDNSATTIQPLLAPTITTQSSSSQSKSISTETGATPKIRTTTTTILPPPSTVLLTPRSNYDFPRSSTATPTSSIHQQLAQHTPGQIIDSTTPPATSTFSSRIGNDGIGKLDYFSSTTSKNNDMKTSTTTTAPSSSSAYSSSLILTPSLLPNVSTAGPIVYQSGNSSNYLCLNQNNQGPSTSSANLTTTTTDPSELVLSPSKLGQ